MFDSKFTFERNIRSISSVAQKLVYLENLLEYLGITMPYGDVPILLSFLVWSIALLFGPLQLIPILNLLIRISEHVNFWFQILLLY